MTSSKRITLSGATVRKHGKKIMGSNTSGTLTLEHTRGSMVVKLEVTHLNEPFLAAFKPGENVDLEIAIKKAGAQAPISQPNIPVR